MDDKKDLKNKEDTEIPTIVLNIEHMCGTREAYIFSLVFLVAIFGIPSILILILSFPHITFEEIIVSSILLGFMAFGIIYIFRGN